MYLLYFLLVIGLCCVMMSSSVTKQMKEHVSLWFLMELYEKHDLEDWVHTTVIWGLLRACC